MKKKIVEGNVGVIILKDSTDYAKSMALKDEKVARMDKDLVEFLMDDTERLKGDQFLSLISLYAIDQNTEYRQIDYLLVFYSLLYQFVLTRLFKNAKEELILNSDYEIAK